MLENCSSLLGRTAILSNHINSHSLDTAQKCVSPRLVLFFTLLLETKQERTSEAGNQSQHEIQDWGTYEAEAENVPMSAHDVKRPLDHRRCIHGDSLL